MKNKGQSLVELVISIGVIMLVLAGTVSLVIFSIGKRNRSFDRDKASRLAQVIVERLVESKKNDAETFWNLEEVTNDSLDGFDGYLYSIEYSVECDGDCVEATVTINWQGGDEELQFNRFFAK